MKKLTLSVGFADMAQFVRLPQALGWRRTVEVLQASFKTVGDIILEHGGRIHKYGGDAILFSFSDPKQAVTAARRIAECRQQVELLTIRYNVAVATGSVFLTMIGHPTYLVEDIIGEPVIKANWLLTEAQRNPAGLALCETTRKHFEE